MFKVEDQVKVNWDGPVIAKVVHVEGDSVTIQRGSSIGGDTTTMTKQELAAMAVKPQ